MFGKRKKSFINSIFPFLEESAYFLKGKGQYYEAGEKYLDEFSEDNNELSLDGAFECFYKANAIEKCKEIFVYKYGNLDKLKFHNDYRDDLMMEQLKKSGLLRDFATSLDTSQYSMDQLAYLANVLKNNDVLELAAEFKVKCAEKCDVSGNKNDLWFYLSEAFKIYLELNDLENIDNIALRIASLKYLGKGHIEILLKTPNPRKYVITIFNNKENSWMEKTDLADDLKDLEEYEIAGETYIEVFHKADTGRNMINAAECFEIIGDFDKAIECTLNQILYDIGRSKNRSIYREDIQFLIKLVEKSGRVPIGDITIDDSLRFSPEDEQFNFLAKVCEKAGEEESARKILELFPDTTKSNKNEDNSLNESIPKEDLVKSNNVAETIEEMVKCFNCKEKIDENWKKCPNCGYLVDRVCEECGKELEPDWKVCPFH